jgi:hypothetical protein
MAQILPREPSLSEMIGSSLGQGLGQGIAGATQSIQNQQSALMKLLLERQVKGSQSAAMARSHPGGGVTEAEAQNIDPNALAQLYRAKAEEKKSTTREMESAETATKKFAEEMQTLGAKLPEEEQAFEEMQAAAPNISTKDKFAEAMVKSENPFTKTLGDVISSKNAAQMRSGVKKFIAAEGKTAFGSQVRNYEIQLLENAYASVGKSKEANDALLASQKLGIMGKRARLDAYSEIMKERYERGQGRPRNIDQLVSEKAEAKMKPLRNQYFKDLSRVPGAEKIDIPGFVVLVDPAGKLRRIAKEQEKNAIKDGYKPYR